ncbi:hypothetical protein KR074_000180, partial [Drosophila pseudoananassae]
RHPSAIDFGISKVFRQQQVSVRALTELSSDHLPLLFIINEEAQFHKRVPKMLPAHANVATFKSYIDAHTAHNTPIATCSDLDAYVDSFTSTITEAAQRATPPQRQSGHPPNRRAPILTPEARALLDLKRHLRR